MRPRIIKLILGPIVARILDNCERRSERYCCGLEAFEILPVWMVSIFEKSDVKSLNDNSRVELENELQELELSLSPSEGSNTIVRYQIAEWETKCDRMALEIMIAEIRNALDVLSKENSFHDLIAGKYK